MAEEPHVPTRPVAETLTGDETIGVFQHGEFRRTRLRDIRDFIGGSGPPAPPPEGGGGEGEGFAILKEDGGKILTEAGGKLLKDTL